MAGVIRIEIHWNKDFTKIKLDLFFSLKTKHIEKSIKHTLSMIFLHSECVKLVNLADLC